jgi:prevent-host-death family protein
MEEAMRTITATDANRHFSRLLREVAAGESVCIVSRGAPVAKLSPVDDESGRDAAHKSLLLRLGTQQITGERAWSRNDLYTE